MIFPVTVKNVTLAAGVFDKRLGGSESDRYHQEIKKPCRRMAADAALTLGRSAVKNRSMFGWRAQIRGDFAALVRS
jgi:hypothetical protein